MATSSGRPDATPARDVTTVDGNSMAAARTPPRDAPADVITTMDNGVDARAHDELPVTASPASVEVCLDYDSKSLRSKRERYHVGSTLSPWRALVATRQHALPLHRRQRRLRAVLSRGAAQEPGRSSS